MIFTNLPISVHCRDTAVGWDPARFERRPTIEKYRTMMVGRRGDAPLDPPFILPGFKQALALLFW
ncbi:MAG: hypothetical protein NTZ32_10720 [Planctomycetales bacterium]|nr:hypothetical protein [Planctomycetales bacterium]